jgi:hypothetical protein
LWRRLRRPAAGALNPVGSGAVEDERVKRLAVTALVAAALGILVAVGAWTTWDYGLDCTKCLAEGRVVEEHVFGFVVFRRTTFAPPPTDYERIFGRPCEHEFRRGGFGRTAHAYGGTIACGMTAEGWRVEPRLEAVAATYDASVASAMRPSRSKTLAFVDTLIAPDTTIATSNDDTFRPRAIALRELAYRLRRATTLDGWRAALRSGRAWRSQSH